MAAASTVAYFGAYGLIILYSASDASTAMVMRQLARLGIAFAVLLAAGLLI